MSKSIDTLIKGHTNSSRERWYPVSIDAIREGLIAMESEVIGYHPLVDNIAYSLQYLEFLDKEMSEMELSSVLQVMLIKSYVITAMGIIEGVFSYIIKSRGWWKTIDEEEIWTSDKQQIGKVEDDLFVKTVIIRKTEAIETQMTFDAMIKCLNRHHRALAIDHNLYPQISRIRDLRNRIHLQKKAKDEKDHDYYAFGVKEKDEVKSILYSVLCSPSVTKAEAISNYDFLKS